MGARSRSLRLLLATSLIAAAGLVALPGAFTGLSVAQTPTPTGPAIQWLNPSGYATPKVLSTKDDQSGTGKASTYHLSTWVANVPSNPLVELKYQSTTVGSFETSIGTPIRVGISDTWEFDWNLKDAGGVNLPNGNYVIKAVLFSSGIEVGRDEETVEIRNADPLNVPRAETAEITQPDNGEPLGFYSVPGTTTPANTLVDVGTSAPLASPSQSDGTDGFRIAYTLSRPGTEPAWKTCATVSDANFDGNAPSSFRCNLTAGDKPSSVTAISAVTTNTPVFAINVQDESGDAHRVFPYDQVPTTMTMAWTGAPPPTNSLATSPGACAPSAAGASGTVTVRDQLRSDSEFPLGRPIPTVPIDVAAKGPTDQLQFDDSSGLGTTTSERSSALRAPDKGHPVTEPSKDCEQGTNNAGTQAQHELPGEADIKHVESTTGTGDAGTFRFAFFLPATESGTTQISIWGDEDEDDLFCTQELTAHAAIAWGPAGTPSPAVSGVLPEKEVCPRPTPGVSPTATGTQTPTATATATTPSQTGTATVTLEASKNVAKFGQSFELSGLLTKGNSQTSDSCIAGRTVILERTVAGETLAEQVDTQVSNAAGQVLFSRTADKSANYVARVEASGSCTAAASTPEEVKVKKKVKLKISSSRVDPGDKVTFKVGVKPCAGHEGERVVLIKFKNGKTTQVAAKRTSNLCKAKFVVKMEKTARWQAKSPKQDLDHQAGKTKKRKVVVR